MFVLNFIINYFIILATAKLCALPLKRTRFAIAAVIGAMYSVSILFNTFGFLANPVMKLVLGFVMTLIAFGVEGKLIKAYFSFLAVSAAFGGAVYAASLLAGSSIDDGFYINLSMRVLALSFAASYFVLTFVFKRFAKRASREILNVKITFCGRTAEFKALRDTGNELFDPISGLPVIVVDAQEANKLLPYRLLAPLKDGVSEFIEALTSEETYCSKFRLVPYSAVGVKMSLLPVFRPDELYVDGKLNKNTLVGLSPNILCSSGEFSAVL